MNILSVASAVNVEPFHTFPPREGFNIPLLSMIVRRAGYQRISYIAANMNKKPLIQTNKYLKNRAFRESMLIEHAIVSARIEGVQGARDLSKKALGTRSPLRTSKRPSKRP
jgi:hypothetical protein